ncbi:MAG: hypothetical protein AAF686_00445 [Pseudomonadota bacterium]
MSTASKNTSLRYAINAGSSVLSVLIAMVILIWVNQYLLKRISPEEYALVPVMLSLMIFGEFFKIIFTRGLSRFMVEADTRGDDAEVTRIVSSMLPVLGAVALVIAGLGLLGVIFIETIIVVEPQYVFSARLMLGLLVLTLCVAIFTTPLAAGLYVHMRFVELNLITLATEASRGGLLVALLVYAGPRAHWVVVSSTIAQVASFLVLVAISWKILPAARFRWSMASRAKANELLVFSLWTSVQALNMFVQRAAPALFLNRFSTDIDVASFYLGNLPNQQIRKVTQAAANPATPALTALYASEGETALREHYYRGGRYHLWAALFLVPPLVAFAEPLMRLYAGESYLGAALVMVILLGVYPFHWSSAMFYQIAYAIGRIKAYNVCSVFMALIALAAITLFVVVLDMGALGAALGMLVGFGIAQIGVIWPFGLKLIEGSWRLFFTRTLLPGIAPGLAALGACFLFAWGKPIETWFQLGIGSLLSAVIYTLVLSLLCMDARDKEMATSAKRRISALFQRRRQA